MVTAVVVVVDEVGNCLFQLAGKLIAQVYHGRPEIEAKTGKTGILWTLHLFHIFGLKGISRHRKCMIDLEMEGLGVSGLSDGDSLSLIIGN